MYLSLKFDDPWRYNSFLHALGYLYPRNQEFLLFKTEN